MLVHLPEENLIRIALSQGYPDFADGHTNSHADANHHLFNLHTGFGSSVPSIEPQFQHHANKPPFDDREKRMELLRRFNEIHGVSLPDDAIQGRTKVVLGEKVVA